MDVVESQLLLVEGLRRPSPLPFPGPDIREVLVIAVGFPIRGLVLDAEVAAARLLAVEGVARQQFREFEEVSDPPGVLQRRVEPVRCTKDPHVAVEVGL